MFSAPRPPGDLLKTKERIPLVLVAVGVSPYSTWKGRVICLQINTTDDETNNNPASQRLNCGKEKYPFPLLEIYCNYVVMLQMLLFIMLLLKHSGHFL